MTFEEQKFLFLIKSYLSAFSFMAHAFVHLGNLYLNKRPKDVSPVFFQKCFSFSSSSMIRFKLIFYMTKDMSRGVFFFCQNQLPTCMSQLLNSLCSLTDLYLYFYAIPSLSWYYCFIVSLIISVCPPTFTLSPQHSFGFFVVPYKY